MKNIIPVKVTDISFTSNSGFFVVLQEQEMASEPMPDFEGRLIPIFVGLPKSQAISVEMNKLKISHLLTHDLLINILQLFKIKVERIVINNIVDNSFHSKILLSKGCVKAEIDARSGDAIALALNCKASIFISEDIIDAINMNFQQKHQFQNIESEIQSLEIKLKEVLSLEYYEEAAQLRDKIKKLSSELK